MQRFFFELSLDYVTSCIFIACFFLYLPSNLFNELESIWPQRTKCSYSDWKKYSFWVASHMCHFVGKVARKTSNNLFLKKKEQLLNSNGNMFNSTKSWTALRDKWSQLRPPLDITMISKGNTYILWVEKYSFFWRFKRISFMFIRLYYDFYMWYYSLKVF